MAAEMVSSMVAQETVSQILSGVVQRYGESSEANRNFERLEMAHIRLEAALETSGKWKITDASLLRWRKKLKRVAQECDDMLHNCKQRIREEQRVEQELMNSSLPNQIAHAAKSFIFSVFSGKNEPSRSMVQRFEWYADGASEFIGYVEVGGTPRCHMPFKSLVRNLLAGMEVQHKIVWGNEYPSYVLWLVPSITPDHGIQVSLKFIHKDDNAPENNFFLGAMLQITESTDIVGTVVNSLQLFPPCFQHIIETIKKELTQLPTQDFSWVPYVDLWQRKLLDDLHGFCSQWFHPDPLCCKKHVKQQGLQNNEPRCMGHPDMVGIPDVSLDSVTVMHLECQVPVSEHNYKQQTTTSPSQCRSSTQDYSPYMRAGLLFTPHGSTKHRLPEEKNSAVVTIYGEEQHYVHTDITLDQLNEIMLPKAADYFYRNPEAMACQMLWKSRHGTEYIEFEKPRVEEMPPCPRRVTGSGGSRKRKPQVQEDQVQVLGSWNSKVACFLNSWVAHAPVRLRGLILDWIQRGKESQIAVPPTCTLRLKI